MEDFEEIPIYDTKTGSVCKITAPVIPNPPVVQKVTKERNDEDDDFVENVDKDKAKKSKKKKAKTEEEEEFVAKPKAKKKLKKQKDDELIQNEGIAKKELKFDFPEEVVLAVLNEWGK